MAGGFDGVRVLVTGGASGIGRASAEHLADRGARVVCLDRDLDPRTVPEGTAASSAAAVPFWPGGVRDADAPLRAVRADVGDDTAVRAAVAAAAAELGGLDVLVNNAGIGAQGTVADNPDEEWRRVFDVNVFGLVRVSRAALPHLRRAAGERGGAAIVNTASIAATAGLPQRALYSASKGAVASLTLAMAADHVADGIRVTSVNPGTVDTPWVGRLLEAAPDPAAERAALEARQPTGRLVSAGEVAAAIAYLAAPDSAATTGTALAVDGGMQGLRLRSPR
ncbi:SDR family NAD(P)-dependent oxidoreductase [Nocardiopsis coralliicola]